MGWFSRKKLCVHCQNNKTKNKFEGVFTCSQCESKIVMAKEGIRLCPVDQTQMKKEEHSGIIIDRCASCNGVWLDSDELESMQKLTQEQSDFASGMVLGMAIG